jgi:hypothetical protein
MEANSLKKLPASGSKSSGSRLVIQCYRSGHELEAESAVSFGVVEHTCWFHCRFRSFGPETATC